ncbi:MAG: hypothetical protein HWN51_01950 [Desulfobacterales bacterium]|nr:hypothetical protein [Desulfobacterales bacterium]
MIEERRDFDPNDWKGFRGINVKETSGIERKTEIIHGSFRIPEERQLRCPDELRIVRQKEGHLFEIPAQFYDVKKEGGCLSGKTAFSADIPAWATESFRLYYGNERAASPSYRTDLEIKKGQLGPQHYLVENAYYKLETMPRSGQIWHMWNKAGANISWHHYEWDQNIGKGGDPCHWAPNCWVAYPDRITHGHEQLHEKRDPDYFDWHYVFGWEEPETEIVSGPVFFETRRRGVVWPHPEHSSPDIKRDNRELIRAEVIYRFYEGSPLIYQYSKIETLEDINVFFIRNCQFVFLTHVFTHMIIAPDRIDILPTDEGEVAVLRLMGEANLKPYDWVEHSLSNILPSKPAYYAYYNDGNGDGFALFQLSENNTNIYSGKPTYLNHGTILSEVHGWSVYVARTFSYTNLRWNPENATFLPKGERYEEENVLMTFRHEELGSTLDFLKKTDTLVKSQPVFEIT